MIGDGSPSPSPPRPHSHHAPLPFPIQIPKNLMPMVCALQCTAPCTALHSFAT